MIDPRHKETLDILYTRMTDSRRCDHCGGKPAIVFDPHETEAIILAFLDILRRQNEVIGSLSRKIEELRERGGP